MDDHPCGLQADEMFARQLDTAFAGAVRGLVHDPATGLAGKDPEAALAGIAGTIPLLAELKDRYLAQAQGPRQKAMLEPLIDRRLDRAGGELGRIAAQATSLLDDRIVAERIADLQQDASLAWHDPAHLRTLGATTVGELRYEGERKGWDASRTDTVVRTGLSDLYAGAVEAALGQDPERAAKLYDHAREVIQPERQAAVERRIERAREERRVTEIVGGLADTPDDPARRPDLDDYQVRAVEATPPDASPELRAQVTRMARIEQARADRAWQAARGRAATGALDWLGENPGAPLMAMPVDLRDGLSPEQTQALDRTAMNGGRVVTDRDLYDSLDDQAVNEPEEFTGLDLAQYRLSLGDGEYIAGDMLALGARALGLAGSAVAGVAAGVAAGAGVLLTPTNSQGTTVELGDGVRLRQPPGDSSGVIEKSALGGSLWDRTPIAVHIQDGATSDRPQILTIDATALERAIGPEAADRVLAEAATRFDVVPIYSSRPPVKEGRRDGTGDPTAASPNSSPPEEPDFKEFDHIARWLAERNLRADKDRYTGADGIDTATGVRLDPRVGEPAAGRDYLPVHPSHRKGLEGEYGLANEFARQFPDHTIIEFGRKVGERGPDVISVNRDGEILVVDSKWRGSDTSIGPSRRAHQTEKSLKDALSHTEGSVLKAIDSGRLSPEATARALENLAKGNVTIVTVGTGSARNGVVERIVGGERAIVHPQRRL